MSTKTGPIGSNREHSDPRADRWPPEGAETPRLAAEVVQMYVVHASLSRLVSKFHET